eukprot:6214741-Pleurochrysis_carterae.AAC.9
MTRTSPPFRQLLPCSRLDREHAALRVHQEVSDRHRRTRVRSILGRHCVVRAVARTHVDVGEGGAEALESAVERRGEAPGAATRSAAQGAVGSEPHAKGGANSSAESEGGLLKHRTS